MRTDPERLFLELYQVRRNEAHVSDSLFAKIIYEFANRKTVNDLVEKYKDQKDIEKESYQLYRIQIERRG